MISIIVPVSSLLLILCSLALNGLNIFSETESDHRAELLHRAMASYEVRERQLLAYTFTAQSAQLEFERHKLRNTIITKYEVVFVADEPYWKRIEQFGKPIAEELQRWDQALQEAQAKTRRENKERLRSPFRPTLDFPISHLIDDFDLQWKHRQRLHGRELELIVAMPKRMEGVSNPHAEYAHHFKMKLWLDTEEAEFVRIEAEVIQGSVPVHSPLHQHVIADAQGHAQWAREIRGEYQPGTFMAMEWSKIQDGVWLPSWFHEKLKEDAILDASPTPKTIPIRTPYEMEWMFSNYKKFHVDTRILPQ